jgi:hypothetical protein
LPPTCDDDQPYSAPNLHVLQNKGNQIIPLVYIRQFLLFLLINRIGLFSGVKHCLANTFIPIHIDRFAVDDTIGFDHPCRQLVTPADFPHFHVAQQSDDDRITKLSDEVARISEAVHMHLKKFTSE